MLTLQAIGGKNWFGRRFQSIFGACAPKIIFSTLKHEVASLPGRGNLDRNWSFELVARSYVRCLGLHLYLELERRLEYNWLIQRRRTVEVLYVQCWQKNVWLLFCVHIQLIGFVKDNGMHAIHYPYSFTKKKRQDHPITRNIFVPLYEPHMPWWMDEVNDHYLGEPSHLTNYMRVNMTPL